MLVMTHLTTVGASILSDRPQYAKSGPKGSSGMLDDSPEVIVQEGFSFDDNVLQKILAM